MNLKPELKKKLKRSLAESGLRSTRQREEIFSVLMGKRDHPTAEEVYTRARSRLPGISLATVYNCLETLVECGLVRQVNFERESSRYCPNLNKHAHFYCKKTGKVYDIDLPEEAIVHLARLLPEEFEIENLEVTYNGRGPSEASLSTQTID